LRFHFTQKLQIGNDDFWYHFNATIKPVDDQLGGGPTSLHLLQPCSGVVIYLGGATIEPSLSPPVYTKAVATW